VGYTSGKFEGSPALLVKAVASYTVAAIYKDEAIQTRKALSFSSLNTLTQKSSPKVRENRFRESAKNQSVVLSTGSAEIHVILGHRPESAPDTLRVLTGDRQFGRIIVFNAVLFGLRDHSALKSPFIFAFFLVNEPVSKSFR
jgi:hypothetical protein